MNDPKYLAHVADRAEELAGQLHAALTQVIVERIMIRLKRDVGYRLTASDKWMLEVLQEAGYLREDLMKELSARTGVILKEMSDAFEDAAVQAIRWDDAVYKAAGLSPTPLRQSPHLMRLVQRGYQKTAGEWRNFTGTMADASQEKFITECDKAYHLTASHAMGYTQAIRQAMEAISEDGVRVTYPSGHTDTIETATARAVRTGVGQACGDITLARMREMGWDIALVSAHLGARTGDGGENFTNHYWLQGKFYSLSGRDKRFLPLSVCGIGDVRGLLGANCRHSIGPGDGEFNPFQHYDSEANRKRYEMDQRQRALERRIRATRREVMGLQAGGDLVGDKYRRKAQLLQRQEAEYDDFCEKNDLKKLYDRLAVARYGPEQARAAERAAKGIENSAKSDIIEPAEAGPMGMDIEVDKFTPCLENAKTGEIVETTYSLASKEELAGLKKKGWVFNWRHKSLENSEIYKLTIKGDTEIQGLIAMEDVTKNHAFHASLAESAPHNRGKAKRYNGVGGHLFAIAAKKSFDKGYGGFIYFEAKNMDLVRHYSKEFGAVLWGRPHQYSMIIDTPEAARLLRIYNSEEV